MIDVHQESWLTWLIYLYWLISKVVADLKISHSQYPCMVDLRQRSADLSPPAWLRYTEKDGGDNQV